MLKPDVVSVIMPAFNAEATIDASIESVVAQTWPHWELLVIVDAATDGTLQIAQKWQARDSRIKVFPSEVNQGVAASRNVGLDNANGDYVAFLDSDDLWLPEKLTLQLDFMRRTGTEVCYGAFVRFNTQGPLNIVVPPEQVSYAELLKGNVIANLTGIVRRDLVTDLRFRQVGHEDFVFWLAALKRTSVARRLPQQSPIARYRVQEASLSSNKMRNLSWQWHIYRVELGFSIVRSAQLMVHYASRALLKRSRGVPPTSGQ